MKKRGFTLVELIVVVAAIGLIMVAVTGILGGVFKANNRSRWSELVERDGLWLTREIRKNLLRASSTGLTCDSDSISFVGVNDGQETVIVCEGNKIASRSGELSVDLNGGGVRVTECSIDCSDSGKVDFGFNLAAGAEGGGVEAYVEKSFKVTVGLRN